MILSKKEINNIIETLRSSDAIAVVRFKNKNFKSLVFIHSLELKNVNSVEIEYNKIKYRWNIKK